MSINAGSLLSTTLTPILREDVHCFGEDTCFSLAFGVPGALMIISIGKLKLYGKILHLMLFISVIFLIGKPFYHITKPAGNMLVEVSRCIGVSTQFTNFNVLQCNHIFVISSRMLFGLDQNRLSLVNIGLTMPSQSTVQNWSMTLRL